MVLISRFRGIKIKINANDHPPPHCHVEGNGGKARYDLRSESWLEYEGFTRADLRDIEQVIKTFLEQMLAQWEELHGEE